MSRNSQKGSSFERLIADYLAEQLEDDGIDRRVKRGIKDTGDIGGLRVRAGRVVVECKNHNRLELAEWVKEAEIERGHDDAAIGIVIHKRRGTAKPGEQYVTMTAADLVALITGERPK